MKVFIIFVMLHCLPELQGQKFMAEEGIPAGMPREKVFKHPEDVSLAHGSKHDSKFLEEKTFPVELFDPPNRNVEESYYNKKSENSLRDILFKVQGYTDTDVIMINRWAGVEEREDLWEADMSLTDDQKGMYDGHGKVSQSLQGLMSNFSQPWPSGKISFFYENLGPAELFSNLQAAMKIWEHALGCIHFEIPEGMKNFSTSTSSNMSAPSNEKDVDDSEYDQFVNGTSKPLSSNITNTSDSDVPVSPRLRGTSNLLRVTVGDGCYATVGYRPWSYLVISEHCTLGVLVHLLGHVLGLPHEHSRPDRHLHIKLHAEHIQTRDFSFLNTKNGGKKCTNESNAGWYDIRSVMHFDPYGLSISNFSSMSAVNFADTAHMGASWKRPSYNDILRLRQPGGYECAPSIPTSCDHLEHTCLGHVSTDCKCILSPGCNDAKVMPRGSCSANVQIGDPHAGSATGAEEMAAPVWLRGRSCSWLLRAGDVCHRVRLTLTLRMEEDVRVEAVALGCELLRVEILDDDEQDGGRPLSNVVCLGDFVRWKPQENDGAWYAQRVIVSTSPQLRVLIKSYPVGENTALARVVGSLKAQAERAVDKACHCNLDLY